VFRPRLFGLIWGLAALAALLNAETPARPRTTATHARSGATGGTPLSDREVEAAIRARFARSKIAEDRLQVRVQGGVATLEGHTNVIQHKGTATRLARAAGARQVVNKIELSEAARDRAAANLAQGRRRAQIKRSEPRSERGSR